MDPTTLNTLVGIIGIVSTIIGIIVGIIGEKSLYEATKINNKAKADNGATVQQAQSIYNGLSAPDVIDITERTVTEKTRSIRQEFTEITNKIVSPSMFLTLSIVSNGTLVFWRVGAVYVYENQLYYSDNGETKEYKIKMWYDQINVKYPYIKCKILDSDDRELPLDISPGFLEIIPQNIYKDIPYKYEKKYEILVGPNQTIIGKSKEGHIVLISIEQVKGFLNTNTAVYMQWSDGSNDKL